MKDVQKFRKVIRGKYKRLAKIVIERKEYLKISEEDESDIKMLVHDVIPEIRRNYDNDSPFGRSRRNTTHFRTSVRCVGTHLLFSFHYISSIPPE